MGPSLDFEIIPLNLNGDTKTKLTIKALKTLMDNYQDVNDKFIYGLKPSSIFQEEFTEIYKKCRHSSMFCLPPVNH